jgi:phosphate starvation-inducible PhoH-like protein
MAKKKNLKGIDQLELEFINEKLSKVSSADYLGEDNMVSVNAIKALNYKLNIKCKNEKQKEFYKSLKDMKIKLNICDAPAGVGKSFLALTAALFQLKNGEVDKIIIIVPTVEASEATKIGLLPGTIEEKTMPYQLATISTLEKILKLSGNIAYKDFARQLIGGKFIEFELLSYARGRTFDNAYIIIDEAENLSKRETLLLIGRMGDGNTKIAMLGDRAQCDRKDLKSYNDCGLIHAINHLSELNEVKISTFDNNDIVRNSFITKVFEKW